MSLTVVQRFYEVAKQEAEAPALGLEYDGGYHDLPWWFVKSKAKHFGIGLLESGALPGEYFYLFPAAGPAWVYAELGGLTVGLTTLPLPADLPAESLEPWFHLYPPAFVYMTEPEALRLKEPLGRVRQLRKIILPTEATTQFRGLPNAQSFRKIFNAGIVHESKHHAEYRRIRQSLNESRVMSPIQIDRNGHILDRPLRYGDVNEACARLSHAASGIKIRKVFADCDFSRSFERIACLYWPIFLGIQSVFDNPERDFLSQLQRTKPEVLHLRRNRLLGLEATLEKFLKPLPSTLNRNPIELAKAFYVRRRLRKKLGGVKALIAEELLGKNLKMLQQNLRLRLIVPDALG